ncbi:S1C family serine protease [Laedolimicola intestinihominis]|uniref:Trypsin-like peptidase domain-containing protein n=1 Tax=Laedolimicola intestinihominis TaxID=3133166 RepID=A0ABV1FDK8_9FIRM
MYDEENKNLSENPDMENETGADVRDTENAGAEGKDSTAAQPESGTTGSQYRYSGPFYQDTDYQRTESRNTESSFRGSVSKKQKKKKNFGRTIAKTVCIALVFGVVAGAAFQGTNFVGQKLFGDKVTAPVSQDASADTAAPEVGTVQPQTGNSGSEDSAASVSAIVKQCMPSLVAITNVSVKEVQNYWGFGWYSQPQQQESTSTGTGIIIGQNDSELLIVTNNHVITGATNLSVVFSVDEGKDGTTPVEAQIKGSDATKDVGVIAVKLSDIPAETMSAIKTATIGDSSQMQVGDQVIAIGNALGYGQSVTKGIVSALDREVTLQNDDGSTISNKLIQTDAAINPGNSGGALLNMKGEVIGINEAKLSSNYVEGMGYAIPISDVEGIIGDLQNLQTRSEVDSEKMGYLGVTCQDVTSDIAQQYDMPEGVYLKSVVAGCAADKAGLKKGDILTRFDGMGVTTYDTLRDRLQYYEAGETVEVTVQSPENGSYVEKTVSLTLSTKAEVEAANK